MNKIKRGLLLIMLGSGILSLTACGAEKVVEKVLSQTDQTQDEPATPDKEEVKQEPKVDVAKPEWETDLSGSITYAVGATATPLTVKAKVSDTGKLSYQWYRNMTNANGGGTLIAGATQETYTPLTTEEGNSYYYAVATNTISTSKAGITSQTMEVIVDKAAKEEVKEEVKEAVKETAKTGWQSDASGWWYVKEDGSYPKSAWEQIDGAWYAFNEAGYIRTGWFQEAGAWYYFNPNGSMAVDTDVDGYHLGGNGKMV